MSNDLKSRLKALRVSEPLRLSKSGPGFKVPNQALQRPQREDAHIEQPGRKIAPNEDAHIERSQIDSASGSPVASNTQKKENAAVEVSQTKHAQEGSAHNERSQTGHTKNELTPGMPAQNGVPTLEHAKHEATKTEATHCKKARNEGPQDGTQADEQHDHSEKPPTERTKSKVPQSEVSGDVPKADSQDAPYGYFKLAHTVFLEPMLRKVSGDCFRLFIWLSSRAWRYNDSNGTLRASVRYIEQQSGIPHATISRSMKILRTSKLVTLLETDYKHGNVWKVSPVAFGNRGPDSKPPRSEGPQNEQPKNGEALSKRASSALNLTTELPHNECNIRTSRTTKNLSPGDENTKVLWAEVQNVGPVEKQRSEAGCLKRLLENYSTEDLIIALNHLKKNGTLGKKERVHSPFKYLATAADDVIKAAKKTAPLAPVYAININARSEAEPSEDNGAIESHELRAQAVHAFETEIALCEREKYIADYVHEEYPHGYLPPPKVITALVAQRWYKSKTLPLVDRVAL